MLNNIETLLKDICWKPNKSNDPASPGKIHGHHSHNDHGSDDDSYSNSHSESSNTSVIYAPSTYDPSIYDSNIYDLDIQDSGSHDTNTRDPEAPSSQSPGQYGQGPQNVRSHEIPLRTRLQTIDLQGTSFRKISLQRIYQWRPAPMGLAIPSSKPFPGASFLRKAYIVLGLNLEILKPILCRGLHERGRKSSYVTLPIVSKY
ncbi:hypothetical protein F5Y06DRAFT_259557 [Hypoxylon sp. FL0890]|nr:hypothetical protein F5Y06DRAFT_259557 [Hypoxylon sp. FL0890]